MRLQIESFGNRVHTHAVGLTTMGKTKRKYGRIKGLNQVSGLSGCEIKGVGMAYYSVPCGLISFLCNLLQPTYCANFRRGKGKNHTTMVKSDVRTDKNLKNSILITFEHKCNIFNKTRIKPKASDCLHFESLNPPQCIVFKVIGENSYE